MSSLPLMLPTLMMALWAVPAFAVDTGVDTDAMMGKARDAIAAEDFSAAIATLTEVVAEEPSNADALNLLGYSSRKSGDLEGAAKFYDAALTINPDHLGALEYQGELFLMTGNADAAKANLALLMEKCGSCEEYEDLSKAIADAGV